MKKVGGTTGTARRWATLHDAARYVSCHPRTITRRFGDGTLSRYRMGRKVMVDLDELGYDSRPRDAGGGRVHQAGGFLRG